MNTSRKFWPVLIMAALTMTVIFSSCSLIIPTPPPTPTATPTLTSTSTSTLTPTRTKQPSLTAPVNPLPELAGKWLDPDTGTTHTIEWQNGEYVVTESKNPDRVGNEVVSSTWENDTLTWVYFDADGSAVTTQVMSVSGNSLYVDWFNDRGATGSTILERVP